MHTYTHQPTHTYVNKYTIHSHSYTNSDMYYYHRGNSVTVQSDNVGASKWMDRAAVTLMYTGYDTTETSTVLRRKKDGTRAPVPCPVACVDYNKYMGGVDWGDQLRAYYATKIKSRKFYKYIVNFLLGVALTNAYILHQQSHPSSKVSVKKFQEVLATQLIGEYSSRRKPGRGSCVITPFPLRHFPSKPPGKSSCRKRGRCARRQEKKQRRDTQWYCQECGVWLCHSGTADDCFLLWHKRRISQ